MSTPHNPIARTGLLEQDQGVIVTGAANGIGRATVARALSEGARVFATDRSFSDSFLEQFESISRMQLRTLERSLESDTSVGDVLREGFEFLGEAGNSLVHCAGVYDVYPSDDLPEERWDHVMDTNAKLSFQVAQQFAKLHASGSASIVLLTSVAFARGDAIEPAAAYAASKGAIVSLTRQLATEWGPRAIRVNAVAPGVIDTAMTTLTTNKDAFQQFLKSLPLGRLGLASEVADVCVFLCSPLASYVTGSVVTVDGGYLAS